MIVHITCIFVVVSCVIISKIWLLADLCSFDMFNMGDSLTLTKIAPYWADNMMLPVLSQF